MAYQFFNPNPRHQNPVGDCTVRSICKALNIPWESAYLDLCMEGYELADLPSSNAVLNSYLHSKGFSRHAIEDLCPSCYTIRDFADEHFKGTFILGTGSHVVCVKDGRYMDSWDSGDEIPEYFWFKER